MIFITASVFLLIKEYFFADPPIEEYKKIYFGFQKLSGYKVESCYIVEYFQKTYRIPYVLMDEVLNMYRTTKKYNVTEEEFLDLMTRWHKIVVTNLPSRIALFEALDRYQRNYLTYDDLKSGFNETNTSEELREKIQKALEEMGLLGDEKMNFFCFLTFIHMVDPKELLTVV